MNTSSMGWCYFDVISSEISKIKNGDRNLLETIGIAILIIASIATLIIPVCAFVLGCAVSLYSMLANYISNRESLKVLKQQGEELKANIAKYRQEELSYLVVGCADDSFNLALDFREFGEKKLAQEYNDLAQACAPDYRSLLNLHYALGEKQNPRSESLLLKIKNNSMNPFILPSLVKLCCDEAEQLHSEKETFKATVFINIAAECASFDKNIHNHFEIAKVEQKIVKKNAFERIALVLDQIKILNASDRVRIYQDCIEQFEGLFISLGEHEKLEELAEWVRQYKGGQYACQ